MGKGKKASPLRKGSAMRAAVQAQFQLFGILKKKGDWFIAYCPPLDLTTQGKTPTEAKKNLVEASELFIVSCLERGTLDLALRELGFIPLKGQPEAIPRNAFRFPVPIPLGFHKRAAECRA